VIKAAHPDLKREHDGKIVEAAKPGDELRHFFRVNEGDKNGFDLGKHEKQVLSGFAAACAKLTREQAKEAMAAGKFKTSDVLTKLKAAAPEQIEASKLFVVVQVSTKISSKSKAFRVNIEFSPFIPPSSSILS
jgi:hypothetical protein